MCAVRFRPRLTLLLCACALLLAGCGDPWGSFERKTLNPGVRSNATPADAGLKFQRIKIASGPRSLDGFKVSAESSCRRTAAVLIFHGRGETIADWIGVQKRLHDSCVSSIVFDYSGHGRSTPPGTIANLNDDAASAYRAFLKVFPASMRRCLLSHSMGGGPMLYAATQAKMPPDCIVIASPFTSLREMAVRDGMPRWFSVFMPDVWDNVEMVSRVHAPLLWVHSRSDSTIPFAYGETVYKAKTGVKTAIVLNGFDHNAIYKKLPPEIWLPVTAFLLGPK